MYILENYFNINNKIYNITYLNVFRFITKKASSADKVADKVGDAVCILLHHTPPKYIHKQQIVIRDLFLMAIRTKDKLGLTCQNNM